MKKTLVIFLFISSCFVIAQKPEELVDNGKSVQVSLGVGAKYCLKNKYDYESRKPGFAYTIEVVNDFWQTKRHFIGIELIGYNYVYDNNIFDRQKKIYYINCIYKRKNNIYRVMTFELDLGLALFTNDTEMASFLSPVVNTKLTYMFRNFEIFVKNSFRWGAFFLGDKPWVLTAGISTEIWKSGEK